MQERLNRLWGRDPRMRFRLRQWSVVALVYLLSGAIMALGAHAGLMAWRPLRAWMSTAVLGNLIFYVLLRSGYSTRHADAAMTEPQMYFSFLMVAWGYLMAGQLRSSTLLLLLVSLTFAAFTMRWQSIARVTVSALLMLAATMGLIHLLHPGWLDPSVDVANLLALIITAPVASMVAFQMGTARAHARRRGRDLEMALDQIRELATRDMLTSLVNRRHMLDLLEAARARTARDGTVFCIALIDIDHFKRINDQHGHAAGDDVLRRFAQALVDVLRDTDTVSRWGGEEFLVLMPDSTRDEAEVVLQRMRDQLLSIQYARQGPGLIHPTASIGVAQAIASETVGQTIERADRALYRAKHAGRDRIVTG